MSPAAGANNPAVAGKAGEILGLWGGGERGWADWTWDDTAWSMQKNDWQNNPHPEAPAMQSAEAATGSLRSPVMTIQGDEIRFWCDGWEAGEKPETETPGSFVLRLAGDGRIVRWASAPGYETYYKKFWAVRDLKGRKVYFEAMVQAAGAAQARLGLARVEEVRLPETNAADLQFVALDFTLDPSLDERGQSRERPLPAEFYGLPFLAFDKPLAGTVPAQIYHGMPYLSSESAQTNPAGHAGTRIGGLARQIILLGMNPSDTGDRPFAGDTLGLVRLTYEDGVVEDYPLTIGESLWWGEKFRLFPEPFLSSPAAAKALKEALRLYPAPPIDDGAFIASIQPRPAALATIELIDNPEIASKPEIHGVTLVTEAGQSVINGQVRPQGYIAPALQDFLEERSLRRSGEDEEGSARRLRAVRDVMYTTSLNFPNAFALEMPEGYHGPRVRFHGDRYAQSMTNVFHHNVWDMVGKVDEKGVYHTSSKGAPWYGYWGVGGTYTDDTVKTFHDWVPCFPGFYYDQGWTRDLGRCLGEFVSLGYLERARDCADYCLRMARVWEESDSPDVLLKGQRLPRHICRRLQFPSTKYGDGCFENDGHGMTALFIYNLWRRMPGREAWLRANWEDFKGLGDWVLWQLDNPELSQATEVLWSDSEGAGWDLTAGASVYCNVACIEALYALAGMARSIGREADAQAWTQAAGRLRKGSEDAFLVQDDRFGKTWTLENAGFGGTGNLGALLISPDRVGFDPKVDALGWNGFNRIAWRRIHEDYFKPGRFFPLGYGVAFCLQSALLTDEMCAAASVTQLAGKACYHDGERKYITPESVFTSAAKDAVCRVGDLGNGVQQAEIVKSLRIMIGVDDSDVRHLRLFPRLLPAWSGLSANGFPALIENGDEWVTAHVSYELKRVGDGMEMSIQADRPLGKTLVRLGAFAEAPREGRVLVDGEPVNCRVEMSGDSWWVRAELPAGRDEYRIVVR